MRSTLFLLTVGCMRPGEFPTCVSEADDITFESTPTWSEDVAPIVFESCVDCHRDDASAPFGLLTYAEAQPFADAMASAVVDRRMPPAGPTNCGECQHFTNAPWLSDEEIATIRDWAAGGAPEGSPGSLPETPLPPDNSLPRVDQVVEMAQPYTPAGGADDYRCFVVDPGISEKSYLTGFSVTPGNAAAVHHVILYGLYADSDKALAAELAKGDDRHGFPCFGTSGIDDAPMVAAWAPGTPPVVYPEGTGVRLTPDMQLIMQVHYHLDAPEAEPDRSSMELTLADRVEREAVLYPAGNWYFELEPGQKSVTDADTTLSFVGPIGEVTIHAVAPHMHTMGRSMQVEVGTGKRRECLLDVPSWDFDWQGLYFYEEPITVRGGSMARISCTWDTSSADGVTRWGDGTEDEMCLALFYMTDLPQRQLDKWYSSQE